MTLNRSTGRRRTAPRGALAVLCFFAAACGGPAPETAPPEPQRDVHPFAASVEKAHNYEAWAAQDAFEAEFVLGDPEEPMLKGTMLFETGSMRSRLNLDGGAQLIWDGSTVWVSPADAEIERARFHALTWPYFAAVPFKLADPGSQLEPMEPQEVLGVQCNMAKLTFDEGVGDTPEDWYIVYQNAETGLLKALAYTVTYGATGEEELEKALNEPHGMSYDTYTEVGGVQISTEWTFRHWNEEEGFHGDPMMQFKMSNPRFVTAEPGAFEKPEDAQEAKLPSS